MIGNDYPNTIPAITADNLGLVQVLASAFIGLCCSAGLGCAVAAAMFVTVRWLA